MRTRGKSIRDYVLNNKKKETKTAEGKNFEIPAPSKEEAAYNFTVSNERFHYWLKCIILRYWEDLKDAFDIAWNDAVDKEDVCVEHHIKVSEKDEYEDLEYAKNRSIVNNTLYTITVYRSKHKFTIQGNSRQYWIRKEFPELQTVVDNCLTRENSDEAKTIIESYSQVFKSNLDSDILNDPVIKSYFATTSRDTTIRRAPPALEKIVIMPNIPITDLAADEKEKDFIDLTDSPIMSKENQTTDSKGISTTNTILQKIDDELKGSETITPEKHTQLKQFIADTIQSLMSDFTNEISKSINSEKIQQDIKEIAEKVLTQDIEDKVKEIQKNAFQKVDKLVDEKIQIINMEKDDINSGNTKHWNHPKTYGISQKCP